MAIRVADACLWLLIAVFLPAAAEKQSNLVCSQTPALAKAGLREGVAISCRLVNFNYTNSTYVIWSFVSRSSAGDNVVVLRDGQRKSYYQAIHSDQFPTLDIGRITADTLLYPSYNVTVIQEDVQVLKSEFSLRAFGMETTSKSPTLNPSNLEASAYPQREPTVPTSPPNSQSSTRKSSGVFFTTGMFVTEYQQATTDTPGRIPSTVRDNMQPMATVPQTPTASRIVPSTGIEITVPTIKQTKASTFSANYRTAEADYAAQSTSRVLTNPQGILSPPPTIANGGSTDQPSFQCNQFPWNATVGVGKDVAITCRLNAAKWTNESYVSWTFNVRSPKYGYRGVTLKDGERMYAAEAIKDVKFPTLFISRVTDSLLAFPDFKVTLYNGTNEVLSTVYTTRLQGVISQNTQPSSSPELSVSTTASATVISSDWHSHLNTDLARSTESQADTTSHLSSIATVVASASLTNAARTSVSTVAITVSSLSTNALASETQQFMASSQGPDSSAPPVTPLQSSKTNGLFWTSATTVDMLNRTQITSEKLPSSGVPMFSTTELTNPAAAISPSASPNATAGSTREDIRTMADSTAPSTKSVLSALSSFVPTQNISLLSSTSGVTALPRATTILSLFSIEPTVPSTRLSAVRISDPESATFSQVTATAASLTTAAASLTATADSLSVTNASSSSAPTNDSTSAVSTPVLPQSSSVTSSVRGLTVGSLPITTKLVIVLATTSSTEKEQFSTEADAASPNSPTVRPLSESGASAVIADATLSRPTTSWPHAALTNEQLTNVTPSSLPHRDTVDGGSLQTMTNSAPPTVVTAATTRWTAAGNSSAAMSTSMAAEGTQQGELPKASTLTVASTLFATLLPLSSAQPLSPSTFHATVNSGVISTPSSGIEPSFSSAAVHTASTSGTHTTFSSSLMPSAALNLTRNTETINFFESSSTAVPQRTLGKSSTAMYSGTPQDSKTENASSELMPSSTIPILISTSNVPAASSYAAASASPSLPTSPSAVSASQTIAQTTTASDSRTLTVGLSPGDLFSTVVPTKGSSLGPASQKPSTIETQSTGRVLSTLRQTTRGIKLPQDNYASGASSCFLSHVTLLISLLALL